ncbi:MAG: DUF6527 family protein [Pseudomonadota bacterium]|nr:DUF6527 family protein [Pseudomonadota bacterium]
MTTERELLRAVHYPSKKLHQEQAIKGSFWTPMENPVEGDVQGFWFICPCGCGERMRITVGHSIKPHQNATAWKWNGKYDGVTLTPDVEIIGHLKARLKDGYWELL